MSNTHLFVNRYSSNDEYYSFRHYVNCLKEHWSVMRKRYKNLQCSEFTKIMMDRFLFRKSMLDLGILLIFDAYFNQYPVYYIDLSLFEKLENTKVPTEIKISKSFVDKAIFLFPKQNTLNIDFGIANCNLSREFNNAIFSTVMFKHEQRWKQFNNMNPFIVNNNKKLLKANDGSDHELSDNELDKLHSIIPQIFLYMSLYPDEGISNGTATSNGTGKGFKPSKGGLLTPQIIGLRESRNNPSTNPTSCPNMQGIKKQTHWRRGHWRQLDDGKVTWVRPCLINPV